MSPVRPSARPLFVVDVDEVVLRFVAPLERFIAARGYALLPRSFALTGNIVRAGGDDAVSAAEVKTLIAAFFAEEVERQEPVDGALDALARLQAHGDVLLLTNVPASAADGRRRCLARHGLDLEVIANDGLKGPALARLLIERPPLGPRPVVFVDDGPSHLASVRDAVADVRLVHFVDDERWFRMAPDVPGTWLKTRDWAEVMARLAPLLAPDRTEA